MRAHVVPMACSIDWEPDTTWLTPTRFSLNAAPGWVASTPTDTGPDGGGGGGLVVCSSAISSVEGPFTPVKVKPVNPVV